MRRALKRGAGLILAIAGLAGTGGREAQAQMMIPYGPYSMTRSQFDQFAPVYYPRINTAVGINPFFGPPRYYNGGGDYYGVRNRYRVSNFNRGGYRFNTWRRYRWR